jgi:hypothetical protein
MASPRNVVVAPVNRVPGNPSIGRNPQAIPRGKGVFEFVSPAIPLGRPSELLFRRPDILAAEQTLVTAKCENRRGPSRILSHEFR